MSDQRSAISRQRREDFPSPSGTFEWRDVCERCSDVIEMPLDGTPPKHLCLTDPIPWDLLMKRDLGIASLLASTRRYRLEYGAPVDTQILSSPNTLHADDPSQTGPFAPGEPPRLILIRDLLLWSRSDLLALPTVSPAVVRMIEHWLADHGLALAPPYGNVLRKFLRDQFHARYQLTTTPERRELFPHPRTTIDTADVDHLRYALRHLQEVQARHRQEAEFKPGDIVSRDGTDQHLVTKRDPGALIMTVVCTQAPETAWCAVGETETNLCRRYSLVRPGTES